MRIARLAFLSLVAALLAAQTSPTVSPAHAGDEKTAGDSSKGRKIFKQCRNCHSARAGRYGTFGPNLYRVVGRRAGTAARYDYSPALADAGFVWTAERLERWLKAPRQFLPGAAMDFSLKSARARADVIAYLIAAGKR